MHRPWPEISPRLLSYMEGVRLRVILKDGTVVEGLVTGVDQRDLRLGSTVVPLERIDNFFTLKPPKPLNKD